MNCTDWPENPEIGELETRGDITYTYKGNGVWEGAETAWTYNREVMWSDVPKSDDPGTPATQPQHWLYVGGSESNWRAEREFKNGQWGPWTVILTGGSNGINSFASMVFKRAQAQPDTPVGGSYGSPVPADWSDGVPAGEFILWASSRTFTQDGNPPQTEAWSTPRQMTDTATIDIEWSSVKDSPGTPETAPDNWHNDATPNEWWKAERLKVNGVWGVWQVVKIRGEDGAGGDGSDSNYGFLSSVFKRSEAEPVRPTGGSWASPVPSGWSDGAPAGEFPLWMSSRMFTDDGTPPQTAQWTTPSKLTNTEVREYQYSATPVNPGTPTSVPAGWHVVPTPADIWMAMRSKIDGVWGAWAVVRTRGEDGTGAARGFNFFRVGTADGVWSDVTATSVVPDGTPISNDVVTIYKLSDSRVNVTKFWNGGNWELPADGGMFFGSIIVDGSVISRHIAASISLTTPRVNGGVLNGGVLQLMGTTMQLQAHIPFGPDGLLRWVGPQAGLTTGVGDAKNPIWELITKANATEWLDAAGNYSVTGNLKATGGEFANVVIKESCTIEGTLNVKQITGGIISSMLQDVPSMSAGVGGAWKTVFTRTVAARPDGLPSMLWVSGLLVKGAATLNYAGAVMQARVLVNDVVTHTITETLGTQHEYSDGDEGGTRMYLQAGSMAVQGGGVIGLAAGKIEVQILPSDAEPYIGAHKCLLQRLPQEASL